ncbi:hypothetical protein E2C01_078156 [Portunus trituberculatus]|uniref:Uncharacterized protein n=1 Tax=Portunus trituberculatus TaxID=210409 RepID=A0A5B7IM55_PORTR|nr:hypothetical protein [Portunus trituberculatus]
MVYSGIPPHRETSQQPPAAPSTSGSKVPAPTQPMPHLLFIPVTAADLAHEAPATGPRFVLGALRRPEFDLILRRAERRRERQRGLLKPSREPETSEWPGVGPITHHDSSGDELSDAESPEGVSPGADKWSRESSGQPAGTHAEKSVWFEDEDLSPEELPRLVPRPYWRNKPPAPRGTGSVPVAS